MPKFQKLTFVRGWIVEKNQRLDECRWGSKRVCKRSPWQPGPSWPLLSFQWLDRDHGVKATQGFGLFFSVDRNPMRFTSFFEILIPLVQHVMGIDDRLGRFARLAETLDQIGQFYVFDNDRVRLELGDGFGELASGPRPVEIAELKRGWCTAGRFGFLGREHI